MPPLLNKLETHPKCLASTTDSYEVRSVAKVHLVLSEP